MTTPRTIAWIGDVDGHVCLIDQTLLPTRLEYCECRTVEEVWEAIKVLRVRGAPAIGIAAAMGLVLGLQKYQGDLAAYRQQLHKHSQYLRGSRPTAVNLFWALDRMERCVAGVEASPAELTRRLLREAVAIEEED